MSWKFRTSSTALIVTLLSVWISAPANSAEWSCELSAPITGGMLHLLVSGDDNTLSVVTGAVELSTRNVAAPLGFRDGSYPWDTSEPLIAQSGAILHLNFNVTLPFAEVPNWGAAAGALVPTQLSFLLPGLRNPTGAPVQLGSIMLISGNGIYNSNNQWRVRPGTGAMIITNTPEVLSLMYSRELLQVISNDLNEPISLFLTPAIMAPTDSIVSFHAGGIIEAPSRTEEIVGMFMASNRTCPTTSAAPNAGPALDQ